jgi:hypothetical protein
MKTKVAGTILAVAAATMFMASATHAQEATSSSSGQQAQVKCVGANDCKGQSACKTATSAGPGQNSCKGQGLAMTSTKKECTDKGGKVD